MNEDYIAGKNTPRGKYTVLVTDDDSTTLDMLQLTLGIAGYRVITANNGLSAIEQVMSEHPHAIVLDLKMPEISGFEVLDQLKERGYDFSSIKIILLTNSTSQEDVDKAKQWNAQYKIKADETPKNLIDLLDSTLKIK